MTGTIKRLTDKGFGFITGEGLQKDLFFHSNSLVGVTFDELKEGDTVSFETEQSPKGLNAVNVQRAEYSLHQKAPNGGFLISCYARKYFSSGPQFSGSPTPARPFRKVFSRFARLPFFQTNIYQLEELPEKNSPEQEGQLMD